MVTFSLCMIVRDEEKNLRRCLDCLKDLMDEMIIVDTGSTDKTVDKLKELGVNVKVMGINPWRFDVARNESLKMVPDDVDICVCTDLDEVFDAGWRKRIEP